MNRYASGPGFHEVLARQTAGGVVAWYLTDRQGSVRMVIDNSATTLATTAYSAFGEVVGGSLLDRYGYTGQEHDPQTGNLLAGNSERQTDLVTGRFLQRDRIFPDSGVNPYSYVGNNPTNATDPSGRILYIHKRYYETFESLYNKLPGAISLHNLKNDYYQILVYPKARTQDYHAQVAKLLDQLGYKGEDQRQALIAFYGGNVEFPHPKYTGELDRILDGGKLYSTADKWLSAKNLPGMRIEVLESLASGSQAQLVLDYHHVNALLNTGGDVPKFSKSPSKNWSFQ